MLFLGQSEDPSTFMICGFKKEHMLRNKGCQFLNVDVYYIKIFIGIQESSSISWNLFLIRLKLFFPQKTAITFLLL